MAVIKCKMCGGDLQVIEGSTVCECEYCGTKQTVPTLDNEKKHTLFNRASRLLRNCEFDKAYGVFENIVAEFPEEAEAYWGLLLCRYGIEYVDDPATGKKIPTCHRTVLSSIMDDSDFDMACENADGVAKRLYREEAKAIDRIQQGILKIVESEEPYDVFICYKELDDNGNRTEDSVLAQEIYDSLTAKGLKTFFARITLENKLGEEYEPYIYAALHSARVMLAVGTSFEHFDAIWVKNEWLRFLNMMKTDTSKKLIPCFKGIDAYDMPREFKNFLAQDMGKLGWQQDLTRGVLKICGKDEQKKETVSVASDFQKGAASPLLKRAYMFLEDGEWSKADDFCEQALNIDPENPLAYVGKLMALLHVHHKEELKNQTESFRNNGDYKKAIRFADEKLKNELQGYITSIEYRNCEKTYNRALRKMKNANREEDYSDAEGLFISIIDHKDSADLVDRCRELQNKMHVERLIELVRNKLDNAYSEVELNRAIAEITEGKEIPEIAEIIRKARDEFEERVPIANQLWDEYLPARKAITRLEDEIKTVQADKTECQNKRSQLKHNAKEYRQKREAVQKLRNMIQTANTSLRELEKKENNAKSELNNLSFFSIGAKKEINARIADLQTRIENEKLKIADLQKQYDMQMREVDQFPSEAAVEQELESLRSRISEDEKEEADITERFQAAKYSFSDPLSALVSPKTLATLLSTRNHDLFKSLLADTYIAPVIRSNSRLLEIAQCNPYYDGLPLQIKEQFSHRRKGEGLDVEAIYFQACQALDYPSGPDDILWAKAQFMKISGYKDADQRVSECNRKIAGA